MFCCLLGGEVDCINPGNWNETEGTLPGELPASPKCFPQVIGTERDPWGKMFQYSHENPNQRKYLPIYLSICLYRECVYL